MSAELERPVAASTPGVGRLGFGLNRAADVVLLVCLILFAWEFPHYPLPGASIAAWAILFVVSLAGQLGSAGWLPLPRAWSVVSFGLLGCAAVLDCVGSWEPGAVRGDGPFPLAAVGCGAVLLTMTTQRSTRVILRAVIVLGLLLTADLALGVRTAGVSLGPRLLCIGLAVMPPAVGVQIVRSFRAMLEFQSDLSQAQAATSTAGFGYGLMESEQLRQLDLRAEQLLDDVATGREPLPLASGAAELASTISTRLRRLLVEGRSRTWLHHAFADSAVLGPISTIEDPEGLSALLAPDQRDGLLTAIWLLAGDATRQAQSVAVAVLRAPDPVPGTRRLKISIELAGVARRRVDPAAWQAISRVGRYTVAVEASILSIVVECALDVVADR